MTESAFQKALGNLTDIQREAVSWDSGAVLVLAGPGSGKTQVLTCRVARLLDSSRDKNFRILALTFTNKAADEMQSRVAAFVPGLEERANIGTFHSFCAQMLRVHGVHIGIQPDFAIYSLDADKEAVLEAALSEGARSGLAVSADNVRFMGLIDQMKSRLISYEDAAKTEGGSALSLTYRLYEEQLRKLNALDFNSLIFDAYRLATQFPTIAARYRKSHPYWMLDEFQDTNSAQYRLIKALAGSEFRNIFAVADDDQIIYQWNGASFRHIQAFNADFAAEAIQLPTNYRCPPVIVEAANKLVAYNAERSAGKKPLIAGKTSLRFPVEQQIQSLHYSSDDEEALQIAKKIRELGKDQWGSTAVLARTRSLLEKMLTALRNESVPAQIAQRRDNFLSPHFRWFVACLTQIARPMDVRNFAVLVQSFNRFEGIELSTERLIADAEASGLSYLESWFTAVSTEPKCASAGAIVGQMRSLTTQKPTIASIDQFPAELEKLTDGSDGDSDLAEDATAWREIYREIGRQIGKTAPLDQFLQELQLRSKEPSLKAGTVALMTVHAAKGREFDFVFVVGLAEDVMPSFQSKKKGENSPEMEEERRNCFVAITRTKECLVLSRADKYRGWAKPPSRFLVEMGFAPSN